MSGRFLNAYITRKKAPIGALKQSLIISVILIPLISLFKYNFSRIRLQI